MIAENDRSSRSRSTCWLWTKYDNLDIEYTFNDEVQYAVWQLEKGQKSERLHHQGFIQLKERKDFRYVKNKWFDSRTHIEAVKSKIAASKYCSKLKTRIEGPWTFGTALTNIPVHTSKQDLTTTDVPSYDKNSKANLQAKSELQIIQNEINNGADLKYIIMEHNTLYKKYKSEISVLFDEFEKSKKIKTNNNNTEPAKLYFFSGEPGTGKSTLISLLNAHRNRDVYVYEGNWWTSYSNQKTLFIDECAKGTVSFSKLNMICDKRLLTAEIKGSVVDISNISEVYIASNYKFEDLFYKKDALIVDAVRRRVSLFAHFRKDINSEEVICEFEKFNTNSRKLICSGVIKYNINHDTRTEGLEKAKELCNKSFLDCEELKDLFN